MNSFENYLRDARVLIVDDEPNNLSFLEAFFEDEGMEGFRSLSDPRDARAVFLEFRPDLVLLDLMMPHVCGFEVMEQLQNEMPPDNRVPIVVLTADNSKSAIHRSLDAGARDFLSKPLDIAELRIRVRNQLENRFLQKGYQRKTEALEKTVGEKMHELDDALENVSELRKQAIYEERLHIFSQVAGGVVHDFNNSLTVLQGCTDLLKSGEDDPVIQRELIDAMHIASYDAAEVVDRLRHFYRPDHADCIRQKSELSEILETAVQLSSIRWKDQVQAENVAIEVKTNLAPQCDVVCNPSELRDAVINLIFNAIDAMPQGGTLTVASRVTTGKAVIEIEDTGIGMTEEVRARCLDAFYSTKGEHGTGLGLAMVQGIVKQHRGELEIESEMGAGTVFRIVLPRGEFASVDEEGPGQRLDQSLKILFSEDDPVIRRLVVGLLEADGHEVQPACNGEEALKLFERNAYDMLLTDLSMPVMNGEQLTLRIKEEQKDFPIMMLTGFDSVFLPDGRCPVSVDLLLTKPITAEALYKGISDLFADKRPVRREELSANGVAMSA